MPLRYHPFPLVCLLFAGCQAGPDKAIRSDPTQPVAGLAASAIAADMASRFAEQAGLATAPISLARDKSEYSIALRGALNGWGYKVIDDGRVSHGKDAAKPVHLVFSLMNINGQVLARLSTDTLVLGRAYSVKPDGATPASPLTLMTRN